jgi:hypothetical protein
LTLAERLLVLALLAQIVWTFLVMLAAGRARFHSVRAGKAPKRAMLEPYGWPDKTQQIANNMNNQFETPTLFYALGLLALVLKLVSLPFAVFSWVYVAARIGHTVVHAGSNALRRRGPIFLVGVVALMIMTAMLAVPILVGRPV